ncbi:MAG: Gfo/Idh/MocA family oxidoreductase [Ferruginibacter sp.]
MNKMYSPFRGPGGVGASVINTALCSFGMSGLVFHAPFIQAHPGFNLYAVWERSKKTAGGIYPGIISFDTIDSMLADEAIDLVIVNTPNHTHFEFAKKALRAGKHVLVEKSFTVTVSEAEELIDIATTMKRQLAVFQNRRYDSDFKTVKKIVEEGSLGDIIEAEFHFDRFKPALSLKQHKESAIPGSGLLHDLGPHLIDQALFLFGMPLSVFGFLKTVRPGSLVNDYFDISLFYPMLMVRLKASLLVKEPIPAYTLHGTKGSFIKQRADIQEDILKNGQRPGTNDWGTEPAASSGVLTLNVNGGTTRAKVETLQGNYMEFYNDLHEAITKGKKLPVPAQDGLDVMRVIEAALASDETKRVIPFSN